MYALLIVIGMWKPVAVAINGYQSKLACDNAGIYVKTQMKKSANILTSYICVPMDNELDR